MFCRPVVRFYYYRYWLWGAAAAAATLFALASPSSQAELGRKIVIRNGSSSQVQISWIHPITQEGHALTEEDGISPGNHIPLDTYVGHQFEIKELPDRSTTTSSDQDDNNNNKCPESPTGECRKTMVTVSDDPPESKMLTVSVNQEFEVVSGDYLPNQGEEESSSLSSSSSSSSSLGKLNMMEECEKRAKARINEAGSSDHTETNAAMEQLVRCVESSVSMELEKLGDEIAFQRSVRTNLAATLENFTCIDDGQSSTPDVGTHIWLSERDEIPRTVHVKHQRAASRIHVIENFIREDECNAMEAAANDSLHHATVADGSGGSRLSPSRKAMQAGITVPWDKEKDDDPIARISRRVYDYNNHVLGLNIDHRGQEDLMSIQYFGRGFNDTEPDRYTPHCDGECTGNPHKTGTRVATMVMYCKAATKGGHTNFRNAGVHVKPQLYNGVFFSYIDPEEKIMDHGFTEHSGCPVFEGHKSIVTQWIRLGVDDGKPWDSFNTLGVHESIFKEGNSDVSTTGDGSSSDSVADSGGDDEDNDEL